MIPLDNLQEWKHLALTGLRKTLDRRNFMRGGLAALTGAAMLGTLSKILSPSGAFAAGEAPATRPAALRSGDVDDSHAVKTGTFFFPRLKFDVTNGECEWNVYPHADVILRRALAKSTNVNVSQEAVVVSLADFNTLRHYPFVFATDQKHFTFPKNEMDNLREFLLRGGFIFGDDCVMGDSGDLFFQDFRKIMNAIYPDNPMKPVPKDHDLFHCYYDFPSGMPSCQGAKWGAWATFDKESDRILTLLSPGDIHCGWTQEFFTPELNAQSVKMGVNIIVYYLSH
jgi:hypothetical protein